MAPKKNTPVSPQQPPSDTAAKGRMIMLSLRDARLAAIKRLRLPVGAKLAIISLDTAAISKLRRWGTARFGVRQTIDAGTASVTAIDRAAFEPDYRATALLEGVRIAREGLRAAGGAFDLGQVRTLLRGISRQAVDKRVRDGSLMAVLGPGKRRRFPTLQFMDDGAVVAGLKAVGDALPSRNPWVLLNFLAHPDDRLEGRLPIDLLKAGQIELVVEAAQRVGQQGA